MTKNKPSSFLKKNKTAYIINKLNSEPSTLVPDSEKSKISINYWLVPIIGILVFLVSGAGFGWFILLQIQTHGLFQGDYFRFGHFQLYLLGTGGGIFAIAIIAISSVLAAVTTMLTISWGPKISRF